MIFTSRIRQVTSASVIASALIVGDAAAGSIVVGDDVNTFGTTLAGANEALFATNVASFLTAGGATKNLLLFEATPADGTRDYSPVILNALTADGFSVTVTTNYAMSFTGFDAVFVAQKFPSVTFLDNNALISYVNNGGGVYLVVWEVLTTAKTFCP